MTDTAPKALLRARDVHRTYHLGTRQIHALRGVDLDIAPGQVIALRGRSGSGKTTLLNCIGGLDHASEGRIWFEGAEVTRLPERDWVQLHRHRIGFIFQAHALMANYTAAENIDLALRLAGIRGRERYRRTDEVLAMMGLTRWADHRTFELSGGQRQRVAIARAIAPKPAMLLADEPTGELDTATGQQILRIFRQAADADGLTVLIATHDLSVDAYADQVYHLQDGQVLTVT